MSRRRWRVDSELATALTEIFLANRPRQRKPALGALPVTHCKNPEVQMPKGEQKTEKTNKPKLSTKEKQKKKKEKAGKS